MVNKCIVKGCNSELKDGFRFPTERPEIFKKWVTTLEKHQKLPPNFEMKFVCCAHFTENDFLKGKKAQINKRAVPTVLPQITDSQSEADCTDRKQQFNLKLEPTEDEKGSRPRRSKRVASLARSSIENDDASDNEAGDISMNSSEDEADKNSQDTDLKNPNPISEVDLSRCDSILTFMEIDTDEQVDSDYEPVTETSIEKLQKCLSRKTEALQRNRKLLLSMEEIVTKQTATILRLEEELNELARIEAEEMKAEHGKGVEKTPSKQDDPASVMEINDYTNVDLQMFAISLFYFSPKVYNYLASIMPYLPPKNIVIDWVKSDYAITLFPTGIIKKENFTLD